jgi:hypothetical protein
MEALHRRCAGLDVHKKTVVASVRLAEENRVTTEVKTFATTTAGLLALSDWLSANDCTHVAMEATGVYWKPDGTFTTPPKTNAEAIIKPNTCVCAADADRKKPSALSPPLCSPPSTTCSRTEPSIRT